MALKQISNLKKRQGQEKRFKALGILAIAFALAFLVILFSMIISRSSGAFLRTQMSLEVELPVGEVDHRMVLKKALKERFAPQSLAEINSLYQILSKIANLELKNYLKDSRPDLSESRVVLWFSAASIVDMYVKHGNDVNLNEKQKVWVDDLIKRGQIRSVFNWEFFTFADSREPEIAGIGAGLKGSLLVMFVFLLFAFPIGVMCAFYLEEFARKNKMTDIIEISINNLAAIPSIIYGLLGLTLYLQMMHLPRSSSIVGGMTLFMLVLPVIIIATRNTIRSIPNTIRDGAAALGASKMQVALHHLLPLSIPGIMTGTILSISRALGETAPLLMVGMVAFIADIPGSFSDPTTVLPVQIYLWSDSVENGFIEKTSAAILVLLGILVLFNLLAIILRKKFERKW
ncbi:MAG: phosphate ABC transporter permease PstA [Rickettsiales bacterium]|nr:phosphate ABC transporter permease PstA [Rickettsiales bacterium]